MQIGEAKQIMSDNKADFMEMRTAEATVADVALCA